MKKIYYKVPLLVCAMMAWCGYATSCGNSEKSHDGHELHDGHDHEKENHNHDEEGEDHDHAPKDSHEGHGEISLKPEVAKQFGVETRKIDLSDFSDVTVVSGQIESKAADENVVSATRSGILSLKPDINQGVSVSAGTQIGFVSSSGVQGGDPLIQARAARDAAKRELDRLAPLHKDGVVSTEVYNNALRAYEEAESDMRGKSQGNATVIAPKSGVITRLLAKPGEYVEAGQAIAIISGNTSLTLRADVPEKYVSEIHSVVSANFRPASSEYILNIDSLNGKMISRPASSVAQNGYIPLYFSFTNNGKVAPGSFAEVYLKSGLRHNVLSVPIEAIVEINGNKCIYTAHGDDHYAKHVVTLGPTDGERVEILSGLDAGHDVVVKGSQVIRMAETSATAVPGHSHNH